jgi:hypothetical protein
MAHLGELLRIQVARGAARLHLVARKEFPEMHFAMGLLDTVHGNALALVATGAAELFRRMHCRRAALRAGWVLKDGFSRNRDG